MSVFTSIIIAILTLILGTFLGYFFASRRELRTAYLLAFEEWCSRLYGEIVEVKERYFDKNNFFDNPVLVISDYRELHDRLIDAYRWRSKIEQEGKAVVADCLKELTDLVDKGWHGLQVDFNVNFQTDSLNDNWLEQIIREPEKKQISQVIRDVELPKLYKFLIEEKREVENKEKTILKVIKDYLKDKIPSRF